MLRRVRTPHYSLKGDEEGSEKLLKLIKVIYSASIYAESSNSRTNTALACTGYDSVKTVTFPSQPWAQFVECSLQNAI